ncbi:MAG TPA: nucleotidyltransferase [Candidatus Limnocylindria bacterium]|jgi:hypothetical protein|nr:nucleotidyltransferase [Candidatus Limnocylindria bacterium]
MAAITTTREATHPLVQHFLDFGRRIKPAPERLAMAKKFPDQVREEIERTKLIATQEPHTRLAGSYGRDVAVKMIKDVDVLVVGAAAYLDLPPEKVLRDLERAASTLPKALGMPGEIQLIEQRRSVRVHFTEDDFDIDLVPVVPIDGVEHLLKVPDRDWSTWVETRPLQYANLVTALNERGDRNLKRLIRALKHWREHQSLDQQKRVKSFWLECLVVDAVIGGQIPLAGRALADVIADAFDAVYTLCASALASGGTPFVPDPTIPANNVAWNWERPKFEYFMAHLADSRTRAIAATTTSDRGAAIKAWQAVFGDEWFVSDAPKWVNTAAAVGAAPIVLPSRPHRFYGTSPKAGGN